MLNILGFNQSLSMLINSWTTLETSLWAIARLGDSVRDTPSEISDGEQEDSAAAAAAAAENAPEGWPSRGVIKFNGVTVCYRSEDEPVLQDISLKIDAGQKIGICGRTGR